MIEPYRMVFVNLFALIATILSICFYRYIFPKRTVNYFILVIIFSLLPLISILRIGVYESGDFAINVVKAMSLYEGLIDGVFPVRWAANLNATYGYPLFIFTYPLPYYLLAFFHFLGFSFIASEKIIISLAYILSGIGMYLFLKSYTKPAYSFFGSILYLYAPYHLVDMHFRVALGEVFSFALIPFLFYFLKILISKNKFYALPLTSFTFFLLILSHQAISLAAFPFAILFLVTESNKIQKLFLGLLSLLWGILLSCFYWLPVLFEKQFTYQEIYSKAIYLDPFWKYIYSPFRYGFLFQGPSGQLSYTVGYIHIVILIAALILFLKSKKPKALRKQIAFALSCILILAFFLSEFSTPFWQIIPLINNFQFASRLLVLVAFFSSFLGGLIVSRIKSKVIIWILILATISSTILNWGNRAMIANINDANLRSRLPLTTFEGEGLQPAAPRWANTPDSPWFEKIPQEHIKAHNANVQITEISRSTTSHVYIIDSPKSTYVTENTSYFPGWNLYINKKNEAIQINKNGTVNFYVPEGLSLVELKFDNTPVRTYSEFISLASLAVLLLLIFHKSR